jgi:hypothetical protein
MGLALYHEVIRQDPIEANGNDDEKGDSGKDNEGGYFPFPDPTVAVREHKEGDFSIFQSKFLF